MGDFTYKEYTKEETAIYHEAMDTIMKGLEQGLGFYESCSGISIKDEELKGFILDDALKIMIADMHYNKGLSLAHVADALQVSIDTINKANAEMLEDIEISAIAEFKMDNPQGLSGTA
jgi:hypothetical protein